MKRITLVFLTALLAVTLLGCGAAKSTDVTLKIATKPMVEQYILGEMLGLLIEHETGAQVEITKGIGGGTSNIQPAMVAGEFDLYPEYTSTGFVMVLGNSAAGVSDDDIFNMLKAEYDSQFSMTWVGLYGFNNTYCVAVRGDVAREYNLTTTSDLAAVSDQLIFGANPDYYEREDGFPLLTDTYGMHFSKTVDIDIGLKYAALESTDIDATVALTTDAQLAVADVVVLEDDLHLQVNYFCSTVVRKDALEKVPALEKALMKMEGLIDNVEMSKMNYAVSVEAQDEKEVARAYLVEKGLLK